ncbi:hypothetical protein MD484_g7610, partial [Candolleomyces efflorescens]
MSDQEPTLNGAGKANTPYTSDQLKWLESRKAAYLDLVTRQAEREEITSWLGELWDEFFALFDEEFQAAFADSARDTTKRKERNRFIQWFRNKKHTLERQVNRREIKVFRQQGPAPATVTPVRPAADAEPATPSRPFFLLQERSLTGQKHYESQIRSLVSNEVSAERQSKGLTHKMHASMLSSALSKRWRALTEEERSEWEEKARAHSETQDKSHIYSNQELFLSEITNVLQGACGPGRYQIGNAIFELLYAYRGDDDKLTKGSITIRPSQTSPTFAEFDPQLSSLIGSKWSDFAQLAVKSNRPTERPVTEEKITYRLSKKNIPFFPEVDEKSLAPSALIAILSDFLRAQWAAVNSAEDEVPWDDIHLHQSHGIGSTLRVQRPETMSIVQLYAFVEEIRAAEARIDDAIPLFGQQAVRLDQSPQRRSSITSGNIHSTPRLPSLVFPPPTATPIARSKKRENQPNEKGTLSPSPTPPSHPKSIPRSPARSSSPDSSGESESSSTPPPQAPPQNGPKKKGKRIFSELDSGPQRRQSSRNTNPVQFGIKLLANGKRSPQGRRGHWAWEGPQQGEAQFWGERGSNPSIYSNDNHHQRPKKQKRKH